MTNQYSKKIAVLLFVLMLGVTSAPLASYAHSNNKQDDKKVKIEKDKKIKTISNKACRQLFWRLFTVGSLKTNENINLFIECLRPLGFEARFTGTTTATTTPPTDITAPVISNIRTQATSKSINVTWNTNENATSRLYYGTSTNLDVNATNTTYIENGGLKKNHSITLNNLAATTTYYMAIESKDTGNNRSTTPVFTTTTTTN